MEFNEAPASVSYSIKTPNGFPCIFTMRAEEEGELINRMNMQEFYFKDNGYEPDIKTYRGKKEIKYVENRKCPKCGSKLVYFGSKNQHIKCSTQKYDFTTKTTSGCDFVEWAQDSTRTNVKQGNSSEASVAQMNLIKDKWPELWKEGMTKSEASDVIKNNFNK